MKISKIFFFSCLLATINTHAQTKLFDDNWRFIKDGLTGAEQPGYPDNNWRKVHLPHDWAIEDQNDSSGTAWYRKSFTLPKMENVSIRFDGVYMDSDVWLNGHHLGNHPYGYTPFTYDLTPYLAAPGKINVLAVRVKNDGLNTRWYSGAGIYRHVYLISNQQLLNTYISTENTTIKVTTTIKNPATVQIRILDSTGNMIAKTEQLANDTITQQLTINNPVLWSPVHPYLYKAEISVLKAGKVTDRSIIPIGIREVHIDAKTGLTINGRRTLLKGACVHHDNGLLGAAAYDRAEERKVELLKAAGFNAIRTTHNPPSEKFLETCDRLGMLVIDEAFDVWQNQKTPQDYHRFFREWWQKDLTAMILRDRNHPSVIMWSIGNEIPERADIQGLTITRKLISEIRKLDNTRPITEAENDFPVGPNKWESNDRSFTLLDVAGYNYQWGRYAIDERRVPGRVMYGSETVPSELYDAWNQVLGLPFVIGDFVWTGIDNLGDANCGDIDLIGNKKMQSYYRDVVWGNSPIEIAVHTPVKGKEIVSRRGWPDETPSWTWPGKADSLMQVRVFTRSKKVRLTLNDELVALKEVPDNTPLSVTFEVPYKPGILAAFALNDGKESGVKTLITASEPATIRLKADRLNISSDAEDLSYVSIEIFDKEGNPVPNADIPLKLEISGQGTLAAAGNASPNRPVSFQQPACTTFKGKALAILKANGKSGSIRLKVTAAGLKTGEIVIKTR
jgi:beta-galactosidase